MAQANWHYVTLNLLYLLAMVGPPILLGFVWWGWFRRSPVQTANWRTTLFFSSLCAGTANLLLWWASVVWLRFHYNPASWEVWDRVSDVGLCLLVFAILASIVGMGKYRLLLGVSGVLALLPWIPIGVL
jgi:hypothetical protein